MNTMKNKKWIIAAIVLLLVAVLLIWRPWSVKQPADTADDPVAETGAAPAEQGEPAEETGANEPAPEAGEDSPEDGPTMLDPGDPEGAIEIGDGEEQGGL